MKRLLALLVVLLLCVSLCSCDTLLKKAKSMVTGEEAPRMPDDYVATLTNENFEYELYENYVKIIKYLGDSPEVEIPRKIDDVTVRVIGSFCFHNTKTKITSVNIPTSVEEIEEGAFYLAESLKEITIPDSVEKLGPRAFAWCNSLEVVNWGAKITSISDYCFNHCESLVTINISDKITSIGLRAFSYCEKLEEITIPTGITTVGDRAFEECKSLKYVTFENANVVLGKEMFSRTPDVVIIAEDNSTAKEYCKEYKLRWSISKDVEAVIMGDAESSESDSSSM